MKQYHLHLKGYVGSWDFDPGYVDYILDKNKDGHVDVLIDSLGGDVASALSIAAAFRRHGDVSVHFVGMNASAATIASLGAKHVSMDASAMYLVHKCSVGFFKWGSKNADELAELIADCEKSKDDLDKLDLNVARMYSGKCKKKQCDMLDVMSRAAWLTAEEALEWGFVDEITDLPEEAAPVLTEALASQISAAGIPVPPLPIQRPSSTLERILTAIASLFTPVNYRTMNTEPRTAEAVEAQPVVEETAEAPQEPTAEEQRIAELEAERDSLNARIAELEAEVQRLGAAPGDSTTAVVEETKAQKEEISELDEFLAVGSRAAQLLDSIRR